MWTKKIPFQLKVIQGRLVAQAFLLGGCCLGAAASFMIPTGAHATGRSAARVHTNKYDLVAPVQQAAPAVAAAAASAAAGEAQLR